MANSPYDKNYKVGDLITSYLKKDFKFNKGVLSGGDSNPFFADICSNIWNFSSKKAAVDMETMSTRIGLAENYADIGYGVAFCTSGVISVLENTANIAKILFNGDFNKALLEYKQANWKRNGYTEVKDGKVPDYKSYMATLNSSLEGK